MDVFNRLTAILLFVILLFSIGTTHIEASEFETGYKTLYTVKEDGVTNVQTTIRLTNLVTNLFPTQYSLTIQSPRLSNITAVNDKGSLTTQVEKGINKTTITIFFTDKVVGKGTSQSFVLSYETPDIVSHDGTMWEITIPKIFSDEAVVNSKATLSVPPTFGQALYFKPEAITNPDGTYTWTQNQLASHVVSAAFGIPPTYEFSLVYHLLNIEGSEQEKQIALPPDTAFQTVVFSTIEPSPKKIEQDKDGNWMAVYTVPGNKTIDIVAKGFIETAVSPKKEFLKKESFEALQPYLSSTPYWQRDSISIQTLGKQLKTPEAIYRYVVDHFTYDYSRVTVLSARKGAIEALASPNRAICTEFTDATVAILRAAGIPAREVNGYAFTNNSELKPLSVAADILHAWPEYYDQGRGLWVPIDPTWENTTGGVDYFHQFDLSHIALVIHGIDDSTPKPAGGYKVRARDTTVAPTKDVSIEPVLMAPVYKIRQLDVNFSSPPVSFFSDSKGIIMVTNPNGGALYNIPVSLSGFGATFTPEIKTIPVLLPWESVSIPVSIHMYNPFTIHNLPVTIAVGETKKGVDLVIPFSSLSIISGILLVGGLILGIIIWKRKRLI